MKTAPIPAGWREAASWALLALCLAFCALAAAGVLLADWRFWFAGTVMAFGCWVGHKGALDIHQYSQVFDPPVAKFRRPE